MVRAGRIVFGVEDQTLRVVGVPDDQVFTIMDAISNAIADSCEPLMIILEGSMQDMLVQNGPMKSSSIADQLGVQKRRAIDILNDMTDKGVIQRIGVNRSIAYAVQRGAQKSREVIDTL